MKPARSVLLTIDEAAQLFPSSQFGAIKEILPMTMGMSGSYVYSVKTQRKEFVLRVHRAECNWEAFVRSQQLAAEAGIGPKLHSVDEQAKVMVSDKIIGVSLGVALSKPESRSASIGSLVSQIAKLHRIEAKDFPLLHTGRHATDIWQSQVSRPGFPNWAKALEQRLTAAVEDLARDTRVVLSHGDVNPGNVLWDGEKAWLIDWECAGLAHPFLDLATLSNFLSLPKDAALGLLSAYQKTHSSEADQRIFASLRDLSNMVYGLTFFKLIPDLKQVHFTSPETTQSLSECFASFAAQKLDMKSPQGLALIGAAFLKQCHEAMR